MRFSYLAYLALRQKGLRERLSRDARREEPRHGRERERLTPHRG